MFKSVTTPVIEKFLKVAGWLLRKYSLSRYLTKFDQVSGNCIYLNDFITLDNDFEIQVDLHPMSRGATANMVLANSTSSNNCLFINDVGALRFRDNVNFTDNAPINIPLHKTTRLNINRSGYYLNGIFERALPSEFGDFVFDQIGIRMDTQFPFDGVLSNLKIWSNGDKNTGSLVLDMPIDSVYSSDSPVVYNKVNPKINLFTDYSNYTFIDTSLNIVDITSRAIKFTSDGTTPYAKIEFTNIIELGKTYIFRATIDSGDSGDKLFIDDLTADSTTRLRYFGNGRYKRIEMIYKAESTSRLRLALDEALGNITVGTVYTIQDIEIIELVQPAGRFVNAVEQDSKLYAFDHEYGWLGKELITQDNWQIPFNLQSGWTYDPQDNTWNLNGDGSLQVLQQITVADQPEIALLSAETLSGVGELAVVSATSNNPFTLSGAKKRTAIFDKTLMGSQQFKRNSAVVTSKVVKPSFKELLQTPYNYAPNGFKRYFTNFDRISQPFIVLDENLVLGNDFTIKGQFENIGSNTFRTILSGEEESTNSLILDIANNNTIRLFVYSGTNVSTILNPSTILKEGLNSYIIRGVSGTLTLTLNGENVGSITADTTNVNIRHIGGRKNTVGNQYNNFDGILADKKIWINGDDLILDIPILDVYSATNNYVENRISETDITIDSNTTSPFVINSPWVDNGNGSYSINGSQNSSTTVFYAGLLKANTSYKVTFEVSSRTSGSVWFTGTGFSTPPISENGKHVSICSTQTNINCNILANADFNGTVRFTVEEITGISGTFVNTVEQDSSNYTYDEAINSWVKPSNYEISHYGIGDHVDIIALNDVITFERLVEGSWVGVKFGNLKANSMYLLAMNLIETDNLLDTLSHPDEASQDISLGLNTFLLKSQSDGEIDIRMKSGNIGDKASFTATLKQVI